MPSHVLIERLASRMSAAGNERGQGPVIRVCVVHRDAILGLPEDLRQCDHVALAEQEPAAFVVAMICIPLPQ